MSTMTDARKQAVTGVVPPQLDETMIRVVWPSVARFAGPAALGEKLGRTFILAPLAGLLMAPFYFVKVLPFLATRYTLTNRAVKIERGWKRVPSHQVALSDIDDVRVVPGSENDFYFSGTLEVLSGGKVAMTLPGTRQPQSFRHAILNACWAWAPKKASPTA